MDQLIHKRSKGSYLYRMKSTDFRERGWMKLDNAAKLFPAIVTNDLTSVFRITASLNGPVKYNAIREAVEITSGRFPYFSVSLASGLFWHYLEFNNRPPRIQAEEGTPCSAFAIRRMDEPLYRVIVKDNRISVEFIHILTDGAGALEYFKSLLYEYLTLTGKQIESPEGIIIPGTPVAEEEYEDGYKKFFRKLPPPEKLVKAWHLPFRLNKRPMTRFLRAEVSVDEILNVSRGLNVTVTEYIIAVYFLSLQEIYLAGKKNNRKRGKRVLRIEVPVNMRSKFKSRTMRNFSLFVLPELDLRLGTYTFDEIVSSVHHQMKLNSDVKQLSRFLSSNVSYEKLFFIRVLPLFLKKMATAAIYRGLASKRWTGLITNLGLVKLPAGMEESIDSMEIFPPPPNPKVKVGCALLSYKGRLRICFSNITESSELERLIFKHLTGAGIHVKILNNNQDRDYGYLYQLRRGT